MVDISKINPIQVTQLDRAPKPTSRAEPRDMPTSNLQLESPKAERRRDPERRRGRGKGAIDRRLSAERRRNAIDIEV